MDKDYVQYSKKVTKWAMIVISFVMIACLLVVAFCDLPSFAVNAVVSLFTAFSTVLGVTIGAYQGNSTLEKYSRAKYQYEEMVKRDDEESEPEG